jgi:hypothetical protein
MNFPKDLFMLLVIPITVLLAVILFGSLLARVLL